MSKFKVGDEVARDIPATEGETISLKAFYPNEQGGFYVGLASSGHYRVVAVRYEDYYELVPLADGYWLDREGDNLYRLSGELVHYWDHSEYEWCAAAADARGLRGRKALYLGPINKEDTL